MKPTQFVLQAQKLFFPALVLSLSLFTWTAAHAQITPLGDSYINTADPTKNYGAATLLDVDGASQTTYIQFNLASIPSTASVSQATLKLYVNSVPTAGSFNVNYVNGSWTESTIDANNAPGLGATIASNVDVTTADKNQYILVNVTSAVQAWLDGSEKNNGIALVANSSFNATFDSKENTSTSHPAELDIAFARRWDDHRDHNGERQRPDRRRHQRNSESEPGQCVQDRSDLAVERERVGLLLGGDGHDHGRNRRHRSDRRRLQRQRNPQPEYDRSAAVGVGQPFHQ